MEETRPDGAARIGILKMDAVIRRIPGDAGNPASYPFPVLFETVRGAGLARLIRERDPGIVAPFVEAGLRLVRQGVQALGTTCGFMILFQRELAGALPVPVFTSSLLQLPLIERALGPRGRIGVVTADSEHLLPEHLRLAGGSPERVSLCGLQDAPCFREAIFSGSGRIDPAGVCREVVERSRRLCAADPEIRALLFECANLPPYAAAVREATGRPVYDALTLIRWVHAGLAPGSFEAIGPGEQS